MFLFMFPLGTTNLALSKFYLCGIEFSSHGPSPSDNCSATPCFHPAPKAAHTYSFFATFSNSNFHNLLAFLGLQINKIICYNSEYLGE